MSLGRPVSRYNSGKAARRAAGSAGGRWAGAGRAAGRAGDAQARHWARGSRRGAQVGRRWARRQARGRCPALQLAAARGRARQARGGARQAPGLGARASFGLCTRPVFGLVRLSIFFLSHQMNTVHCKINFGKKYILNLIKLKSNQIKFDKIFEK